MSTINLKTCMREGKRKRERPQRWKDDKKDPWTNLECNEANIKAKDELSMKVKDELT